jgi:Cellulase (glycosyl hydrolase family 5)
MARVAAATAAVLVAVGCAQQQPAPAPPRAAQTRCGDQSHPYVCASGTGLVYHGRPLSLLGAALYPSVAIGGRTLRGRAWSSGAPELRAYIDHWLGLARDAGLNTIRPTDFLAGVRDWRDATTWRNLDYLVSAARARGLLVILDLSAYRNFLRSSGRFAYDPAAWQPFVDFVAARYAGAPNIAYYAVAGEIEAPGGHDPGRATADQYVAFYRAVLPRLHAADGGRHLVSTGGLNHLEAGGGIPWQALFDLPGMDVAALHLYSESDRQAVAPAVAAWTGQRRKPLTVEEFGFQQSLGDAERAAAFRDVYALARRLDAAGTVFWNLGPELAPNSYDVSPATPATWSAVASR